MGRLRNGGGGTPGGRTFLSSKETAFLACGGDETNGHVTTHRQSDAAALGWVNGLTFFPHSLEYLPAQEAVIVVGPRGLDSLYPKPPQATRSGGQYELFTAPNGYNWQKGTAWEWTTRILGKAEGGNGDSKSSSAQSRAGVNIKDLKVRARALFLQRDFSRQAPERASLIDGCGPDPSGGPHAPAPTRGSGSASPTDPSARMRSSHMKHHATLCPPGTLRGGTGPRRPP
ncbi:hypothetical protein GCM10010278_63360 [Streptomyces melanogenes]|nr:hypothetical protein GCM10010278_63360 [Streptomyces melanogenes]